MARKKEISNYELAACLDACELKFVRIVDATKNPKANGVTNFGITTLSQNGDWNVARDMIGDDFIPNEIIRCRGRFFIVCSGAVIELTRNGLVYFPPVHAPFLILEADDVYIAVCKDSVRWTMVRTATMSLSLFGE